MTELIANGASRYQIVTPGRFSPVENHAAENLQEALYRMTGVRLPVRWARQRLPERPAFQTDCSTSMSGQKRMCSTWCVMPSMPKSKTALPMRFTRLPGDGMSWQR